MKIAAAALFSLLIPVLGASAHAPLHGAWTITPSHDGQVQLMMTSSASHQFGDNFRPAELGLSDAVLNATTSTPVALTLSRDAGSIVLEGSFRNGDGAGQFTFTPNRTYLDSLRATGVAVELSTSRPEMEELYRLAIIDVSIEYVRAMHAAFRDASLRDIWKARAVGVTPEYLTELRGLSFAVSDLREATKLAAVGVTVEYVRGLRAAGVAVSNVRDATQLRAVDVTPQFIADLAAAGYRNVSTRDLIRMKATGVDARFIRDMSPYKEQQKNKQ